MTMIGAGNTNAIFTKTITGSDSLPCLALNYSLGQIANEDPDNSFYRATYAQGGTTSPAILITLKSRDRDQTACTDITYTISAGAAKVDWAGTTPTYTATALTLKDAIDLLNEIPGIQAWAMHCPHYYDLNAGALIAETTKDIPTQPGNYLECLYRDFSEISENTDHMALYLRVGNPEMRDAGAFKLIGVDYTGTAATSGEILLFKDDIRDFGAEYSSTYATMMGKKQVYVQKVMVNSTWTAAIANTIENAPTVVGPLLAVLTSTDLTSGTVKLTLQQATI
jgi:hypothetical protein